MISEKQMREFDREARVINAAYRSPPATQANLANVRALTAEVRRLKAENAGLVKFARLQLETGDAMFQELEKHGIL